MRDFAQVRADGRITATVARDALALLDVDDAGFDSMDRALLLAIIDKFDGGPVGLDTLAAAVGEERDTIEDVYEPFLIQEGFLARTPRGPRRDGARVRALRPRAGAPPARRASCSEPGQGKRTAVSLRVASTECTQRTRPSSSTSTRITPRGA